MKIVKKVGQNIRAARLKKEWSQEDLAHALGWDNSGQGRIGHYELGTREPRLEYLVEIANALDTTLVHLLTGCDTSIVARLAEVVSQIDPSKHDLLFENLKTIALMQAAS